MHQPFYKDALTGRYSLPWVRLHAAKDYLHMAEVLAEYPRVKATFNFVPSLVEQIEDYAERRAEDRWEQISRKERPDDDDKRFMLESFFSISWDRFIRRYPRYWQILQLRNNLNGAVDLLSETYWRDLAVLFNLAWIEPTTIAREPELGRLVDKGRGFSQHDVDTVLDWHHRIAARVLPAYHRLLDRGQIEVSTSPYFHPILPLLVDTRSAREATPGMTLPNVLFHFPEDAREQLRLARRKHKECFGAPPTGLWPSEGALSHAVCELLTEQGDAGGWRWAATDEALLAGSLGVAIERDADGNVLNPEVLYQPYRFADSGMALVFRDRVLSDRIGFVYRHFGGQAAADDLVDRLRLARQRLGNAEGPWLAPIVLDGENCWEEYADNGNEFLNALYRRLSEEDDLETVTLSEYVAAYPPRRSVERLKAGSWIYGSLETWIGEEEQNRAWEYLALARARLLQWQVGGGADADATERAWHELRVAEGSDWFWWYYSRNKFGQEAMFDQEFRAHLGNVYLATGLPVPPWLTRPILGDPPARFRSPAGYIHPRLSSDPKPTLEWTNAGFLDARRSTGAVQQGGGVLSRVYYGFNPADLYVRLEASEDLAPYSVAIYVRRPDAPTWNARPRYAGDEAAQGIGDAHIVWEVMVPPHATERAVVARALGFDQWETIADLGEVARKGAVLEVAVPLEQLDLRLGDTIGLIVALERERRILELLPSVDDDPNELIFTLAAQG